MQPGTGQVCKHFLLLHSPVQYFWVQYWCFMEAATPRNDSTRARAANLPSMSYNWLDENSNHRRKKQTLDWESNSVTSSINGDVVVKGLSSGYIWFTTTVRHNRNFFNQFSSSIVQRSKYIVYSIQDEPNLTASSFFIKIKQYAKVSFITISCSAILVMEFCLDI